jgi:hypothetical protein
MKLGLSTTLRCSIALLAFCTCAVTAASQQSNSPAIFAANVVREALKENAVQPEMRAVSQTSKDLRRVVSKHLDSRILPSAVTLCGQSFRFDQGSRSEQLSVIVLRYSSPRTTEKMAKLVKPLKNYFKNSIILIRFSVAPIGTLLVVTYSENSGDDRIVKAIDDMPARFAAAARDSGRSWSESGNSDPVN